MVYTIGYEKQYEQFKNKNKSNASVSFNEDGYKTSIYNLRWENVSYVPSNATEKFLLTKSMYHSKNIEEIVGTYDNFEEVYEAANDLNSTLYMHKHCANLVFSNRNIKYRPSIRFVVDDSTIYLDNYSCGYFKFDENIINEDNFNYELLDKISPVCKTLVCKSLKNKHIKENIKKNILKNINTKNVYETRDICHKLLSFEIIDPVLLFNHVYNKDIPLKDQYGLISECFSASIYAYYDKDENKTDSLFENENLREILEECYMNTKQDYYISMYIINNYKRLSKKYTIDIYSLLKHDVGYDKILKVEKKIKSDAVFYGISKCINMSENNSTECIDFLWYVINNTKRSYLNKITLSLLGRLVIDQLINYTHAGESIFMTNESNFQLIADATIEELIKTKKNKVVFIKKVQNKDCDVTLFSKCLLKSIYASNDIKIKKALVKIGVEGK